jgi:2-dehydropantoate 2-reductase
MNDAGRAVAVVGTGALATLFGARLSRAGCLPTLIGTWQAALDAIARQGLTVEAQCGSWAAPARASVLSEAAGPFDLALVLVKSHQTDAVGPILERVLGVTGLAITLQNGLGNAESLRARLGAARVAQGVTYAGAALLAPGRVRDAGDTSVVLGQHLPAPERLASAAALLASAGFSCTTVADISRAVWTKLAVNCALNPLAALHGVPNGRILEIRGCRQRFLVALREVAAVAAANGHPLSADIEAEALAAVRRTAANRCSMLQDLERGVATEIAALNGAVVAIADRLGVPVPVNRQLVQEIEQRQDRARDQPEVQPCSQ